MRLGVERKHPIPDFGTGIAAGRPRWKRDHEPEAARTPNPRPEVAGTRMLESNWLEEAKGGRADEERQGKGTLALGRRTGGKWGGMGVKPGRPAVSRRCPTVGRFAGWSGCRRRRRNRRGCCCLVVVASGRLLQLRWTVFLPFISDYTAQW